MLSFRDTELRSSAGSLTLMSHSGRRTARRRLAAYPAVNSPMIAVSTTNACSSAAGSPAGRSAASSPWPRRASPACGNGSAWTWPNCGPREAPADAEAVLTWLSRNTRPVSDLGRSANARALLETAVTRLDGTRAAATAARRHRARRSAAIPGTAARPPPPSCPMCLSGLAYHGPRR
jgi:hypothetical protein